MTTYKDEKAFLQGFEQQFGLEKMIEYAASKITFMSNRCKDLRGELPEDKKNIFLSKDTLDKKRQNIPIPILKGAADDI